MLHPDIIDAMIAAGATAQMVAAACRAAHETAAKAKSEKRTSAAARQRAKRQRDGAPDLVDEMVAHDDQKFIDAAIETVIAEEKAAVTPSHTESRESRVTKEIPPIPPKENTSSLCSEVQKDSGGSAGARTTSDALDLADELGRMAGFEPVDCPPGWCGASHTIQKFFNGGCPADVIRTAIRAELKRLSGAPPPDRFGWFEKPIARAFANFQRSVPVVAVPKMEIINGGKTEFGGRSWGNGGGRSRTVGSATDAAAELQQYFARRAEEDERAAAGVDCKPHQIADGRVPLG